ncbi:acyl-CoA desaturase [Penicillium brevicompactum]|uniref:Acyl-CoA desaturase n=1 Tax=Penicillium brevicompactum TaxID=5074 RepID=A0A9W9R1C2_PENBR|nr:acyl-CoA desaturase [Penicillium brevicompactum]
MSTRQMSPQHQEKGELPPNNNPAQQKRTPWYQQLDWLMVTMVLLVPALAGLSTIWVPFQRKTQIMAFFYSLTKGFSITGGYHRLWSHKSYKASTSLQIFLMLFGAGAGQGSIKLWCREHRAHHRYVDTDQDPYSVQKGLFYSHVGWIIFKDDPNKIGRVNVEDLKRDPIVAFQADYYWQLFLLMAYMGPTFIAGLGWGDWLGGYIYGGLLGTALVQQSTFCINSLAHWMGDQPYGTFKSARNCFIVAILTLGEGYHNFHHEFPSDWRNGVHWYEFDPTKWNIWLWTQLGLVTDLRFFSMNEINKSMLQASQKELDKKVQTVQWGVPIADLPVMLLEDYYTQAQSRNLILIERIVYDITEFHKIHPGGVGLIKSGIGKDATRVFNDMYKHSNVAMNLLAGMRIAVVDEDM